MDPAHEEAALRTAFGAMADMVRALVTLAGPPDLARWLDIGLEGGAFLRMEIGIGRAGPIGAGLMVVNMAGEARELVYLAAPPTETPFTFVQR